MNLLSFLRVKENPKNLDWGKEGLEADFGGSLQKNRGTIEAGRGEVRQKKDHFSHTEARWGYAPKVENYAKPKRADAGYSKGRSRERRKVLEKDQNREGGYVSPPAAQKIGKVKDGRKLKNTFCGPSETGLEKRPSVEKTERIPGDEGKKAELMGERTEGVVATPVELRAGEKARKNWGIETCLGGWKPRWLLKR